MFENVKARDAIYLIFGDRFFRSLTLLFFFQKEVSYKLSKKYFFEILGFLDKIFLMKVLVFQNFDQKVYT